jgi:ribosomal-protein-alanine N-acetyltransferase
MAGSHFSEGSLMQRLLAPFRKIAALMLRKKTSAFVRHATQKDAQQFAALHAEGDFSQSWSQDDFEGFLTDRSVIADVLCDPSRPERLYGFVLSRRAGGEAEILTITLARAVRGRGWSRVLLSQHLSHLTSLGVATLFLEVEDGNRPAMALYQSQGFKVIGKRPAYYHRRDGSQALALVMRLTLGGF